MNLTDSRLAQGGCEKLELAMLSFFEQFRKIYVGDQVTIHTMILPRNFFKNDLFGDSDTSVFLSVGTEEFQSL